MNKKGVSAIVITVVLVALVLVATRIVWGVIKNIIEEGAEQISLGKFMIDLEIKYAKVTGTGVDVKVKRNPGAGELSKIKFIINNGTDIEVFGEETTMQELEEKTFSLAYSGLVKEVSIAPVLKSEKGKELLGNVADKFELSDKELIKNLGMVSWWKFEGDAQDEVGGNHGNIKGANCNVDGKFGKTCEFDGVDDYINCGNDTSLDIGSKNLTISAWIYTNDLSEGLPIVVNKEGSLSIYINDFYRLTVRLWGLSDEFYNQYDVIQPNNWHHVVVRYNGSYIQSFIDGIGRDVEPSTGEISSTNAEFHIGMGVFSRSWNGYIDELIIFNKALTDEEVKALYELDFS